MTESDEASTEASLASSGAAGSSQNAAGQTESSEIIEASVSVSENKGFNLLSDGLGYVVKVDCVGHSKMPERDSNVAYISGKVGDGTTTVKIYQSSTNLCPATLQHVELASGTASWDANGDASAQDGISLSFTVSDSGKAAEIASEVSQKIISQTLKTQNYAVSGYLAPSVKLERSGIFSDSNEDKRAEFAISVDPDANAPVDLSGSGITCHQAKACDSKRACQLMIKDNLNGSDPQIDIKAGEYFCFITNSNGAGANDWIDTSNVSLGTLQFVHSQEPQTLTDLVLEVGASGNLLPGESNAQ